MVSSPPQAMLSAHVWSILDRLRPDNRGFFEQRGLQRTAAAPDPTAARTKLIERATAKRTEDHSTGGPEDAGADGQIKRGVARRAVQPSARQAAVTGIVASAVGCGLVAFYQGLAEAFGRQTASFRSGMGQGDGRPLGLESGGRSGAGADGCANPSGATRPSPDVSGPGRRPDSGGDRLAGEGCDLRGAVGPGVLPEPLVCGPEERWQDPTGHGPPAAEHLCRVPPFQDGGDSSSSRHPQSGRLFGQGRPEGRVSVSPDSPDAPASLGLQVGGQSLSVQGTAIRSRVRPVHIHEDPSPGDGGTTAAGHSSDRIPGRHPCVGAHGRGDQPSGDHTLASSLHTGICGESREVRIDTVSGVGVSGVRSVHRLDQPAVVGEENPEDFESLPGGPWQDPDFPTGTCQLYRHDDGGLARSAPDATAPTGVATAPEHVAAPESAVGSTGALGSGSSSRLGLVDQSSDPVERPSCESPGASSGDSIRRGNSWRWRRLGSSVRRPGNRRPLDTGGTAVAHQRPGAPGGFLCSPVFHQERLELLGCSRDGQHGGCYVHLHMNLHNTCT